MQHLFCINAALILHQCSIDSASMLRQWSIDSALILHHCSIDSTSMQHWFCINSASMWHSFFVHSASMQHWFSIDSASMQHWFCIDSASMQHRFCINAALILHQCSIDSASMQLWFCINAESILLNVLGYYAFVTSEYLFSTAAPAIVTASSISSTNHSFTATTTTSSSKTSSLDLPVAIGVAVSLLLFFGLFSLSRSIVTPFQFILVLEWICLNWPSVTVPIAPSFDVSSWSTQRTVPRLPYRLVTSFSSRRPITETGTPINIDEILTFAGKIISTTPTSRRIRRCYFLLNSDTKSPLRSPPSKRIMTRESCLSNCPFIRATLPTSG